MKPKGGDGMNEKMEQIRRAVKAGKLTADGARKALKVTVAVSATPSATCTERLATRGTLIRLPGSRS